MEIRIDDLSDPAIGNFLENHINDMESVSPPESKHALDRDDLKMPDIIFWSAWDGDKLVGCGAPKELDSSHCQTTFVHGMVLLNASMTRVFILSHLI